MTSKKRKVTKVTLIAIFILIACGYLGAKQLQKTSPIFNFFFSPNDLYSPLVCTEFNLSKKSDYLLEFINKYPGNHKLAVIVERPAKILEKYNANFIISLDISMKGQKIINTQLSEENIWPFWGKKNNSGFAIFTYKTPSKLPQAQPLRASIHVAEPDDNFFNTYGKQKLCFSKYSDE